MLKRKAKVKRRVPWTRNIVGHLRTRRDGSWLPIFPIGSHQTKKKVAAYWLMRDGVVAIDAFPFGPASMKISLMWGPWKVRATEEREGIDRLWREMTSK